MAFGIADAHGRGGIADFADTPDPSYRNYKLMNAEYTDNNGNTVVHLFVRDDSGTLDHVEVVDHNPSFYIRAEAYDSRVDNHYAVSHCEAYDSDGERYKTLHGDPLVRVYTHTPDGVREFREQFDDHYEADVLYTNRFLIDSGIHTGVRIDMAGADYDCYHGDYRVSYDAVEPLSVDGGCFCEKQPACTSSEQCSNWKETPTCDAKMLAFDIEVGSEDGVPSTDRADWPVTTIVAWDSYTEQYRGWMYAESEAHEDAVDRDETGLDELTIYRDESEMLDAFNQFVSGERPDILTGWFSNDFDIPYLINRCRNLNVYSYRDWSPLGDVYESKYEPVVKGVACVDMLGAYQKTQIHKLDSKKLDAIAEKELSDAKLDVEDGHTEMWRDDPTQFLKYNKVDVELVHRIDGESGATDLLDNLRAVVGCSWTDPIGGNIDMMDILFLRKAQEYGYVLPTAQKPEKDWYYGAKVFEPSAGVSENVVYQDVASLYPNLIKQLNVSPEMLRSEKPDEEHSTAFIDTRADEQKKDTKPETEEIYYSMESRGFVASLVDELIEMKNEYRGTGKYEAVKRITNSLYGVLSDADSYSKGFRLFDWRMGESICIAGRMVITECSELAIEWCEDNGYEDAYIKMGDTDGFGVSLPSADGMEESLRAGYEMEQYINKQLPSVSSKLFDIDQSDNEMEIECESYADKVFVKGEDDGKSSTGVRKKYVQQVRWEK